MPYLENIRPKKRVQRRKVYRNKSRGTRRDLSQKKRKEEELWKARTNRRKQKSLTKISSRPLSSNTLRSDKERLMSTITMQQRPKSSSGLTRRVRHSTKPPLRPKSSETFHHQIRHGSLQPNVDIFREIGFSSSPYPTLLSSGSSSRGSSASTIRTMSSGRSRPNSASMMIQQRRRTLLEPMTRPKSVGISRKRSKLDMTNRRRPYSSSSIKRQGGKKRVPTMREQLVSPSSAELFRSQLQDILYSSRDEDESIFKTTQKFIGAVERHERPTSSPAAAIAQRNGGYSKLPEKTRVSVSDVSGYKRRSFSAKRYVDIVTMQQQLTRTRAKSAQSPMKRNIIDNNDPNYDHYDMEIIHAAIIIQSWFRGCLAYQDVWCEGGLFEDRAAETLQKSYRGFKARQIFWNMRLGKITKGIEKVQSLYRGHHVRRVMAIQYARRMRQSAITVQCLARRRKLQKRILKRQEVLYGEPIKRIQKCYRGKKAREAIRLHKQKKQKIADHFDSLEKKNKTNKMMNLDLETLDSSAILDLALSHHVIYNNIRTCKFLYERLKKISHQQTFEFWFAELCLAMLMQKDKNQKLHLIGINNAIRAYWYLSQTDHCTTRLQDIEDFYFGEFVRRKPSNLEGLCNLVQFLQNIYGPYYRARIQRLYRRMFKINHMHQTMQQLHLHFANCFSGTFQARKTLSEKYLCRRFNRDINIFPLIRNKTLILVATPKDVPPIESDSMRLKPDPNSLISLLVLGTECVRFVLKTRRYINFESKPGISIIQALMNKVCLVGKSFATYRVTIPSLHRQRLEICSSDLHHRAAVTLQAFSRRIHCQNIVHFRQAILHSHSTQLDRLQSKQEERARRFQQLRVAALCVQCFARRMKLHKKRQKRHQAATTIQSYVRRLLGQCKAEERARFLVYGAEVHEVYRRMQKLGSRYVLLSVTRSGYNYYFKAFDPEMVTEYHGLIRAQQIEEVIKYRPKIRLWHHDDVLQVLLSMITLTVPIKGLGGFEDRYKERVIVLDKSVRKGKIKEDSGIIDRHHKVSPKRPAKSLTDYVRVDPEF
eukprot:g1622.t1